VIDSVGGQQFRFFLQGIDQANAFSRRSDHFARVGVKADDYRFSSDPVRFGIELVKDLLMSAVYAIESSYGDYRLPEAGQEP